MKIFGSISKLVSILFKKDSQDITLRPNQSTTYSAARDVQFPAGDADHVLVGTSASQTLTNKTIDADLNTISNIENSDIKANAAIDASKIADGSVSSTEFQYINSLTSNAQTQISSKANDSDVIKKDGSVAFTGNQAMGGNKLTGLGAPSANGDALRYDMLGANSGIATLDGGGKVPVSQLPSAIMTYEGVFDASATPASPLLNGDGAANTGMVYRASVAGSYDFGAGAISFGIGDYAIYNSSGVWEKSDSTDAVVSVNGSTGVVTVNAINELTGDVTASAASGSQSKATTIASGAVTGSKIASDTITNSNINSAAAIAYSKLNLSSSIVNADVNASAAIAYSKLNLSGSIVNADINASAAIAYSKLSIADGDLTIAKTSGLQTALDGKLSDAGDTSTGDLIFANQKGVKFSEATGGGSSFIYMKAPAALAADLDLILPATAGSSGYVLSTDGSGTLSWVAASTSASFAANWALADGATKTITHNLGSKDVIVQIYDKSDDATIDVTSVVRTDTNTIDLTASEAPSASGWRVLIIKL
jgi:hypothetical protein